MTKQDLIKSHIPQTTMQSRNSTKQLSSLKQQNIEFESARRPSFDTQMLSKRNLPLYPAGIQVHSIELNSPWQNNSAQKKKDLELNYQTLQFSKNSQEPMRESQMVDGFCQTRKESEAELIKKKRETARYIKAQKKDLNKKLQMRGFMIKNILKNKSLNEANLMQILKQQNKERNYVNGQFNLAPIKGISSPRQKRKSPDYIVTNNTYTNTNSNSNTPLEQLLTIAMLKQDKGSSQVDMEDDDMADTILAEQTTQRLKNQRTQMDSNQQSKMDTFKKAVIAQEREKSSVITETKVELDFNENYKDISVPNTPKRIQKRVIIETNKSLANVTRANKDLNMTNNVNIFDKIKINDIMNPFDYNESTDNLLTEHDSFSQPSRLNQESLMINMDIDQDVLWPIKGVNSKKMHSFNIRRKQNNYKKHVKNQYSHTVASKQQIPIHKNIPALSNMIKCHSFTAEKAVKEALNELVKTAEKYNNQGKPNIFLVQKSIQKKHVEIIPQDQSQKESKESLTLDPFSITKKELIEPRRLIQKARKAQKKNAETSQRMPTLDESQQFENLRRITGLSLGDNAKSLVMTGNQVNPSPHHDQRGYRRSMNGMNQHVSHMNQSSNYNLSDIQSRSVKPVIASTDANGKIIYQLDLKRNAQKMNTILLTEMENQQDMSGHGTEKMNMMNKIILTEAHIDHENNQDLNQDIMDNKDFENTLHAASPGGFQGDPLEINDDIKQMGPDDVLQPSYRKQEFAEFAEQREAMLITPHLISHTEKIVICEADSLMQTPNVDLQEQM